MKWMLPKMIMSLPMAQRADIVIEATGNGLEQALKCVTPGGKVLPFGMDSSITASVVPNEITRWATKILGSLPRSEYHGAFDPHLPENRLDMEPFLHQGDPPGGRLVRFRDLGLDIKTLEHGPRHAMKIVMKP